MRFKIFNYNLCSPVIVNVQSSITNEQTLEVKCCTFNQGIFVQDQQMSELGNVNSCIGLACNPETIFGKLRELFEPESHTLEVIVCSAAVIVLDVSGIFVD